MRPSKRPLTAGERALVLHLWGISAAGNALPPETLVEEMDDGGMGSLSFVSSKPDRLQGKMAGACSFADADGVLVEATLLLDRDGDLFQLDIWKVTFGPLTQIPDATGFSPVLMR